MATQSGLIYKKTDSQEIGSGAMEETLKSMEKIMQQLMEDRRKREEEIALERAAREKEAATRVEEMKTQVDALVSESHNDKETAAAPLGHGPQVKLVPLTAQDDNKSYLVTFERIMDTYKVPKEQWTYYLAPQLTGKAQQAFAALSTAESQTYDGVKSAILLRYGVYEEAYRRRFRAANRKDGETNRELAVRLLDLQNKWLKKHTTVDAIKEQVALEQFLSTLALEMRAWVRDKKPGTCIAAGELADEYELARKLESQEKSSDQQAKKQPSGTSKKWCSYCKISGHTREDCRKLQAKKEGQHSSAKETPTQEQGKKAPIKCFNCKQEGHIAINCPSEPAMLCDARVHSKPETWRRSGKVEGKFVQEIVLDTGCKRTMVRQELVPPENILEGDVATIRCAHGDTVLYPLAKVQMEVDGIPIQVEAAVSTTLPRSVLLGEDVPELQQLIGSTARSDSGSEDVMVVVTRAQAKKQLEEELISREQEVLSGAQPSPVEGLGQSSEETSHTRRLLEWACLKRS